MIKLPASVRELLFRLTEAGHEAFIVGGCVRDSLLGKSPQDWDICTSAEPADLKACFSEFRLIETGLKHGTLTVLMDGQAFEITTYRIDGDYSDGRHPDKVSFTPLLSEDLRRRDFTMNAMAYHPDTGIADPFGGAADLKKGLIRCVGSPEKRFSEDGLRIMRALRFSSRFGFEIEEKTSQALFSCCRLLERVSAERIRMEFDKLLAGDGAINVLRRYGAVIACFLPEIRPMFDLDQKNPYHCYTVWEHTLHAVAHVNNTPVLKLAAFFHDIGKPGSMTVDEKGAGHFYKHEVLSAELADQAMLRLRYDNRTRQQAVLLVRNHSIVFQQSEKQARRLLFRLGEENLRLLMELECADVKSQNPVFTEERILNIQAFGGILDHILAKEQCFSLRHLAVKGGDLLALGIPQGPEVGKVLKILLDDVLDGRLSNEKDVLLEEAKRFV